MVASTARAEDKRPATATVLSATVAESKATGGSLVTLTASVTLAGAPLTVGEVSFCEGRAKFCHDIHKLGTAQLTKSGTAVFRLIAPAGTHSYRAIYMGKKDAARSETPALTVTVAAKAGAAVKGALGAPASPAAVGAKDGQRLTYAQVMEREASRPRLVQAAYSPSAGTPWSVAGSGSDRWSSRNMARTSSHGMHAAPQISQPAGGTGGTTSVLTASGAPGSYTLSTTVTGSGPADPTGTVSFLDLTSGVTLGTAGLTPVLNYSANNAATYSNGLSYPWQVVTGDFNNDGIPDLAVANQSGSQIAVYLGNGDGTFTYAGGQSIIGNSSYGIAVGDFNRDGNLDIVATDYAYGLIFAFRGNGDGTFQGGITSYDYGGNPGAVTVADFNGDGFPDVVVVNDYGPVDVLFGDGSGDFYDSGQYLQCASGYCSYQSQIVAEDFNGDHQPDFAVADYFGNDISVFLNQGYGNFNSYPTATVGSGGHPSGLAAADLNGDGFPDLAFTNFYGNSLGVALGNGDGSFQNPSTIPASTGQYAWPYWIGVADFNQDGYPDLAVTNFNSETLAVYFGNGTGSYDSAPVTVNTGSTPNFAAIADFNGDGYPDVAVPLDDSTLSIFLSQVSSGSASVATLSGVSVAGAGTHTVDSVYSGDSNDAPSTSNSVQLAAQLVPTSMSLSAAKTISGSAQGVQLSATLTPYSASGYSTNGETITFSQAGVVLGTGVLSNGVATFSVPSLPVGSYVFSAAYGSDGDFTGSSASQGFQVVPTATVGAPLTGLTATLTFTASGTLGPIHVLTQGATGLDFNFASGGTCAAGTFYSAGQTCTVNYTFTPTLQGMRFGAVTLQSNSSALLATTYISGIGFAPQAVFTQSAQSVLYNTSGTTGVSGTLNALTTDSSGNVYYSTSSSSNNGVYKIAAGTGTTTQIVGGLSLGDGIAIDGAGNVFYTDYLAGTVNELLGGRGSPILIAREPNPEGLAFDLQQNLYVCVSGAGNVVKFLAGTFTPSTTYGTGLAHPQSVAIDADGNVYITDRDGAKAVVVTPDGATQTVIARGINTPAGLTLDAAGNIYIAVIGGPYLEKFAAGTFAGTILGSFVQPTFVALDASGNVLVVDRGSNTIDKLTRATASSLTFASTQVGNSSAQQVIGIENDGNAPLTISSLAATTNFNLSGAGTTCVTGPLAAAGTCNLGIVFAPTSAGGPLTGSASITDNSLNAAGTVQSIALSGSSTLGTKTLTFLQPGTPVAVNSSAALTGMASNGDPVTFSILSGTATISGSTITYTTPGTVTIAADSAATSGYSAATQVTQSVTVNLAPQVITFNPLPTSPDVAGDSVVLSATGGASGQPVIFSVLSGPASLANDGVTLLYTGAGTVVVAADQAGSDGGNYAPATEATATTVVKPAAAAYNAGTVPVAQQSSILTAALNFPDGGTIGSLNYLTQGAPNLDFIGCTPGAQTKKPANPKGGTSRQTTFTCPSSKSKGGATIPVCSVGDVYSAGQICTVSYVFQPQYPDQLLGAITAVDNNGNPMGTSYLSGLGTGPQVAFYPGTQSVIDGSNAGDPFEIATDAAGDIYLGSFATSQLLKYTPNGGVYTQSTIGRGFGNIAQIAVDGAGNLLVADPQSSQVYQETFNPSNGQYAQSVLFNSSNSSDNSVWAVAEDASGNVFLSGSGQLLMESRLPAGGYAETVLPFSFNFVTSLALDSSGDLFVADAGAGTLYELTNTGGGNYTQSVVVSGYGNLNGVAVDASGVVYASSTSTSSVLRYAPVAGGGYAPLAPLGGGFARLNGVGLDSAGNVYVADDGGANTLSVIQVSTPASLAFADTNVGSASSNNPQTVTVANIGYDPTSINPLTFSGVSTGTTSFMLDAANACSASTSLEPGQTCALAVDFTPQVPGTPLTDAVTLADNNLNNITDASSPQTVALSGNGLQQTPVITVAPAALDYATASTSLSATVAYTGSIAPTGAVTFIIDSGSAVTASCSGTASPLSCTATYPTATLSATTHTITATLAATPGFLAASGTNTLTVNPIALTLTAGSYTGVYDGNTHALSACTVSPNPDGLTCTNSPAGPVGPGIGHSVVSPVPSGPTSNYIVVVGLGSWTITPAVLTVTAGSYTGVYDGNTHALSACTVSPNPDGLTCTNTFAGTTNVPAGPLGPDVGHAGVVPVPSGPTSNYIVGLGLGSWTITSRPVTLSAGSYTGTYDGSAHTVPTCATTYAGVTCTNAPASVGPGIGSGAIQPVAVLGTAIAADYQFSPQQGSWSITKAATVTTLSCPVSVVYNGTAQMPCTANVTGAGGLNQPVPVTYGYNTVVGQAAASANFTGDANYLSSSATTTFQITPAPLIITAGGYGGVYDGASHSVSACTVSANPDGLGCRNSLGTVGPDVGAGAVTPIANAPTTNYTVTSVNGSWSITPRSVTVTAGSYSGVYDGATHAPSACTSSYAGVTCTDLPASVGPGVASGTVNAVVSYGTGSAADYTLTKATGTYSITPASASITPNPATKVYGTADPTLTGATTGFLPADSIVVSYSRTPGQTVAGSPYTISASIAPNAALSNYKATYNTAAFSITQANAAVTPNAATKVYGTADPTLTGTLTGFLSSDNVAATYSRIAGATVGGYPISATLSPTWVLSNYNITYNTAAFTVTQISLTAAIVGTPTKTYNGTSAAALTSANFQLTGVVTGDSLVVNQPVGTYASASAGSETVTAALSPANFTATSGSLANYVLPVTGSGPGQINQAAPVIAWLTPAAITYGTALSAAQLNATANVAGSLSYSPASGVLTGGQQTLSVTFTPTDSKDYTPATASVTLTVNKATPTIAWTNPAAINYGTLLSGTQLNATASVPGTFVYSPAAGTVPNGGLQTLTVTFTPTDATDYNTQTKSVTIQVNETTVTASFPGGPQTYQTWTNIVVGPSWSGNYATSKVPTGTVTIYDNGTALVTLSLGSNGLAYWTTSPPLNVGAHNLTVSYSGDKVYPPGLSAVTNITVLPAKVNFQQSCYDGTMYNSSPWQCSVSISASTTTTPSGVFTYALDGGSPVSVAVVQGGSAVFTIPGPLQAGAHTLTFNYAAQGNYAAAGPFTSSVTVQQGQSELQMSPSSYYLANGSSLKLAGTLASTNSGYPTTGLVTIYDNGTAIGTATLGANGSVSYSVTGISLGSHSYSAKYAGSTDYTAVSWGSAGVTAY